MNAGEDVRIAAFEWLGEQVRLHGDVLGRGLLESGFRFRGEAVPLVGPKGIWKPRAIAAAPLSITTAPSRPYDDSWSEGGLLLYRYRGEDPEHPDNAGLRRARAERTPLVYFHGVARGRYLAVWPVFVVTDHPASLTFTVAVDDVRFATLEGRAPRVGEAGTEARRAYITRSVRARIHQRTFRERVLVAYREQCALCRLRHAELLDAAHIVPDVEPGGEPLVTNGLALCKLHHAAFDGDLLGVRPDYRVEVRREVLEEEDGPMLIHGLKGVHGSRIVVPRRPGLRPDPERLEHRYARFRSAG